MDLLVSETYSSVLYAILLHLIENLEGSDSPAFVAPLYLQSVTSKKWWI